jgi:hypothetical protein
MFIIIIFLISNVITAWTIENMDRLVQKPAIFSVRTETNCEDIKLNTVPGRIAYKYNSVTSMAAVWKGLEYNNFPCYLHVDQYETELWT